MVPAITTSDGLPTIFVPLVFIVIVTALKDIYEDLKRKTSDSEENNLTS
jgi:phospholipid-transporting ATPase